MNDVLSSIWPNQGSDQGRAASEPDALGITGLDTYHEDSFMQPQCPGNEIPCFPWGALPRLFGVFLESVSWAAEVQVTSGDSWFI